MCRRLGNGFLFTRLVVIGVLVFGQTPFLAAGKQVSPGVAVETGSISPEKARAAGLAVSLLPTDSVEIPGVRLAGKGEAFASARRAEKRIAGEPVMAFGRVLAAPEGAITAHESEPNDTPATANPLPGTQAVVAGNIWPVADLDYFAFTGNAGDRVYAATMTSFAAGATDTTLTLFDTDGTTIIEVDTNDGSFAASSSSIAGASLPANGTYFLQVRATSATASMRPYHLYLKLQSGSPTAETEPNNLGNGGEPLPVAGWVSGAIDPAGDNDAFTMSLNPGDTVFLSLDLDPERDGGTSWNGRLGLGTFGNPPLILVVNDANTTSPNSEAFFFTVKEAGSYYAYVDHPTGDGGAAQTYHLSVAVFPFIPATASCTTYSSTDVPVVIPTGPGLVESTLTVPGSPRIADIDVTIVLTHTNMPDLDVVLLAPGGNQVVLFNDLGINTQQQMNLTLDDEAAIPMGSYTVMSGMIYQPPATRRLDWFDGQDAGGTWTLRIYDDLALNGGVLQEWSITICEPPPPPACPVGTVPVTIFSSDFEADDGGFTSAGTQDEWQWGAPNFAPITTCNSGDNCWVTDLTGTYNASSNQDLFSPAIDLSGFSGPILVEWAQQHQIENANWDNAFVDVQETGGANPTRLWEWLGPTMSNLTVGNPDVLVPQSAGWSRRWADISAYAGESIELRFNLSSDSTVNFAGLAIDDVSVTACVVANPAIELTKTVGTNKAACAVTDEITVPAGTEVTYCYNVENTGDIVLNLHDLVDSELGSLLSGFPYALAPGASAFLTQAAVIHSTTVNTATWTAYNQAGPSVQAEDSATVNVETVGTLFCNTDPISIPSSGTATPYPADIAVAALPNSVTKVRAHLLDVNHTWPDDIDILLVGPQGHNLIIMSDAGGSLDLVNVSLYFDDDAAEPLPDSTQIFSGTYLPTNWGAGDTFPAPAPAPSAATQLATFNGTDPNGTWSLYVYDDTASDSGAISGGWCLEISAETVVPPPNIDVDPANLGASQAPNQSTQQVLTVANTGSEDLHWSIAEELLASPPPPVAPDAGADPAKAQEKHDLGEGLGPFGDPPVLTGWIAPEAVLHDNGPLVTHLGGGFGGADASALQTGLGLSVFGFGHALASGFRVADDFTVPAGGWWVDSFTFFAYQTGSSTTSTIDHINLRVWDGPPGDPGSAIVFGDTVTNRLASSTWTDMYRVTETALTGDTRPVMASTATAGVFLPEGTYWVDWQTGGTLASGPWAPPVSILGLTAKVGANARQFDPGAASWNDLLDTGTAQAVQDLPFIVNGAEGLPGCMVPSDIPWLSVNPTAGITAGGGSTPVTVTFDSSGLLPGFYTGNLCVFSNDPDPGPGNGTELVVVPVALEVTQQLLPADVTGTKTVSGNFTVGGAITYTIVLSNAGPGDQGDNPGDEFSDTLPAELTATGAAASSGIINRVGNTVTWNGAIPAGGSVTLTITATINPVPGGTVILNQGDIFYDSVGDGENDATRLTDYPGQVGDFDPTPLTVLAVEAIPAAGTLGLLLLLGLLLGAGVFVLRRIT